MARITFNGAAGDRWENDTGKVQYQFIASLSNTCGVCLQYHMAIGPRWPIPLHYHCNCRMEIVPPGAKAEPFVDYRELLDKMPPDQQTKAVGRSNFELIQKGVVKWDDVVTSGRIRTLREVVARKKLSVDEMVKAGVKQHRAETAYASVNTPVHQLKNQQRKQLIANLQNAGLTNEQIKTGFSTKIGERVGIVTPGSEKVTKIGPKWTDAASLAKYLGLNLVKVVRAASAAEAVKATEKDKADFAEWFESLTEAEQAAAIDAKVDAANFRDYREKRKP